MNCKDQMWHPVGTRAPRVDGEDKVTGRARFGADLMFDNMLWGQPVRTPYPHARIARIDKSKAEAVPGVVRVLTAEDVPGSRTFGVVVPHQPVLCWD